MKKWMITIVMLILAGIALFVFVSPLKSHKAVSQQDLRNPDFLNDKEVLLYFLPQRIKMHSAAGKAMPCLLAKTGRCLHFR